MFYDTTGDNNIAPDDVLKIINYINAFGSGGEGEASEGSRFGVQGSGIRGDGESGRLLVEVIELLAMDVALADGEGGREFYFTGGWPSAHGTAQSQAPRR